MLEIPGENIFADLGDISPTVKTPPVPVEGPAQRGQTILVADDEPPLLRLLEFLLIRQGYTVRTATNGVDALEIVRRERPDLIILDVMMPGKDGYEVAATIRAEREIADTPVVMLTAKAQDEDRERGILVGVDTYITKPFEPEHLTEVISTFLGTVPMKTGTL